MYLALLDQDGRSSCPLLRFALLPLIAAVTLGAVAAQTRLPLSDEADIEAFFIFCYDFRSGSGPTGIVSAAATPHLLQSAIPAIGASAGKVQEELQRFRDEAMKEIAAGRGSTYHEKRQQVLANAYSELMAKLPGPAQQEMGKMLA